MRNALALLHTLTDACVRGACVLAVISLGMGLVSERWDGGWVWSQGDILPLWAVAPLLVAFAGFVTFGQRIQEPGGLHARRLGLVLAIAALVDVLGFYRLAAAGRPVSELSAPPTLGVAALLLIWIGTARADGFRTDSRTRRAVWLQIVDRPSN